MILTVTPSPTLDRVVFVRHFRLGAILRAEKEVLGPSGKGVDASLVLHQLGHPTLATGLMAGHNGRLAVTLLDEMGIDHDFVWAEGETRHALVLVDLALQEQSTVTVPSLRATEHHFQMLVDVIGRHLPAARSVILAGSLPAGWPVDAYTRLIARCQEAGVPTLLDTSGPPLAAALAARGTFPDIVKANLDELRGLGTRIDDTPDDVARVAAALQARLANEAVIVTLGDRGAIVAAGADLWYTRPPSVPVANTAGAGDALAACVAWGRATGQDWPSTLRLATAAAAAVVETEATAHCEPTEVERLLEQVQVVRG